MGRVAIPAAAAPGRVRCEIEWSGEEVSAAVALLRELQSASAADVAEPLRRLRVGAVVAPEPPARAPAPPQQQRAPQRQQQPQPQRQPQQQPQRPQQQQPRAPAAAPPRAPPAAPAAASAAWERVWRAPPEEHSKQPVSSLLWRAAYDTLPSGDGHAGWLLSASKGLINLWECSPSGGLGEPALTVMHTQMTDFRATCMDFDEPTQLVLAAAQDVRPSGAGSSVVCLHSMAADARGGLLSLQGALRPAAPLPGGAGARPRGPLLCASLSALRGPLDRCAAVAFGADVTVTQLPALSGGGAVGASAAAPAPAPSAVHRAQWRAAEGGAAVTCLSAWPGAPLLLTGCSGGGAPCSLRGWDLRAKPGAGPPAAALGAGRGTLLAAAAASEHAALTVTSAGDVALWDLRAASAGAPGRAPPLASAPPLPQGAALTAAALSPGRETLAVTTAAGQLLACSLRATSAAAPAFGAAWAALGAPPAAPVQALTWNARTHELLAAGNDGALSLYRHF